MRFWLFGRAGVAGPAHCNKVMYARIQEMLDRSSKERLNKAKYQKILAGAESHVRSLGYRFVKSSSLTFGLADPGRVTNLKL